MSGFPNGLLGTGGVVYRIAGTPGPGKVIFTGPAGTLEYGDRQATLVSGTNIKTINGSSVLGTGNVTISLLRAAFLST